MKEKVKSIIPYWPVLSVVLSAVFLFKLMWKYPAASVLFVIFFLYLLIMMLFHICTRNISGSTESIKDAIFLHLRISEKKCLLFVLLTAVMGMFLAVDSYFLFQLLYGVCLVTMLIDFISGMKELISRKRKPGKSKKSVKHRILYTLCEVAAVVLFYLLGTILPYASRPQVSAATEEDFDITDFYNDEDCGERAKIISDNGEALEERLRMIAQAQDEIILCTFEFDADTSGKMVLSALMDAADRGVKVSVLVDGFSYMMTMWENPYFLALIQTENVEVKVCNPIRLWAPWDFLSRMHDKYLIVDDTAYILGGRNTYDYFLGDQKGKKNYDWDILVYSAQVEEDSSLNEVKDYFLSVWNLSDSETVESRAFWEKNPVVTAAEEELQSIWDSLTEDHADWLAPVDYESITVPVNNITLVSNPIQTGIKEPVVFYEITELMMQAKESVVLHTPYIVCNEWMTERLTQLCDSVDEVILMTNSIANNGNYFGAADYSVHKEEILETGAQILEYDGGISYHGKCFVIDDRISAIGSFNLDMRSTYIDTETMLVVDSEELNQQLREAMEEYEEDALTVIDTDTSIPPAGKSAREVSKSKNMMIQLLLPFEKIRFII